MHQDKDRSGKRLYLYHGDAIQKLAGITHFTFWSHVPLEVFAPRCTLDGLLEITYPGDETPRLVLIEIGTYPSSDADRQVFEDIMIVSLEDRQVPDVVSLILKPRGQVAVAGPAERISRSGRVAISGHWLS